MSDERQITEDEIVHVAHLVNTLRMVPSVHRLNALAIVSKIIIEKGDAFIDQMKPSIDKAQLDILAEISEERENQNRTWGEQNHLSVPSPSVPDLVDDCPRIPADVLGIPREEDAKVAYERAEAEGALSWGHITVEELSEAVSAKDDETRRIELVQLAAVVVSWIECIDRRRQRGS